MSPETATAEARRRLSVIHEATDVLFPAPGLYDSAKVDAALAMQRFLAAVFAALGISEVKIAPQHFDAFIGATWVQSGSNFEQAVTYRLVPPPPRCPTCQGRGTVATESSPVSRAIPRCAVCGEPITHRYHADDYSPLAGGHSYVLVQQEEGPQ